MAQDWKKLGTKRVYDGWRKVDECTYRTPEDKEVKLEVLPTLGAVAVLAITEDLKVVTFRQFRPGPGKWLNELPGGVIDPGESAAVAVKRELLEETGYEADMEDIGSYWRDAYFTGRWHMFVGRNARQVQKPERNEVEVGSTELLTLEEFKVILKAGELTDAVLGYAGLHHLGEL